MTTLLCSSFRASPIQDGRKQWHLRTSWNRFQQKITKVTKAVRKQSFAIFVTFCACLLCASCATTTWQSQLSPNSLAGETISAVAQHYGGQKAADLASAGLSATAEVLQGYVDKKPPVDIITQSPGVEGVGHVMLDYLKTNGVVSQSTVDNIHKAAAFAARVTYTAPRPDVGSQKSEVGK